MLHCLLELWIHILRRVEKKTVNRVLNFSQNGTSPQEVQFLPLQSVQEELPQSLKLLSLEKRVGEHLTESLISTSCKSRQKKGIKNDPLSKHCAFFHTRKYPQCNSGTISYSSNFHHFRDNRKSINGSNNLAGHKCSHGSHTCRDLVLSSSFSQGKDYGSKIITCV